MSSAGPSPWQAVIAAPGFNLGVRCDEAALHGISFLPPGPAQGPANALAAEAARQLVAYLADPEHAFDLPLLLVGTPFQRRVWQRIAVIPVHQTRSYGDIAGDLGSAARAVGGARRRPGLRSQSPSGGRSVSPRARCRRQARRFCAAAGRPSARRQALAAGA